MTALKGKQRREFLGYGLAAASIWLGWEVLKQPLLDRAPPELAVRMSPGSPEVLRRNAESRLTAGETELAGELAAASLQRAPFNVKALRVRGLAMAEKDRASADRVLTLAGNWSLRDDPTHGWLVSERLRQGSYTSAFAHADTLARRRVDTHDPVFNLLTTAGLQDSRALPPLARLLAQNPPWRLAYINELSTHANGDALLASLLLALEESATPPTNVELQRAYETWLEEGRLQAVRLVRARLNRPTLSEVPVDGNFSARADTLIAPFSWTVTPAAGIVSEVIEDDLANDNLALRVEYDGYATGDFINQLLVLNPGSYRLAGRLRMLQTPEGESRLAWKITCFESGAEIASYSPPVAAAGDAQPWTTFSAPVVVPASQCSMQRLRLTTRARDFRETTVAWFDDLRITAARPSAG